jgi:hypothetical protein
LEEDARRKHEQAIKRFSTHTTLLQQQIEEASAGTNWELCRDLGKMLDQCREFWVKKVKETESKTRATAEAQQQVALDILISEKLKDLDQKAILFLDVFEE